MKDIYKVQRQVLYRLRKEKRYADEAIRKEELQVDISEIKIN
jgi:hypothetical protein